MRYAAPSGSRRKCSAMAGRREIPVDQLVPGDVVELSAGDIVPGDCRLLSARDLFVNQAMLTGEPYPVEKQAADLAAARRRAVGRVELRVHGYLRHQRHGDGPWCAGRGGRRSLVGLRKGSRTERPRDAFASGIRQFGFLMLRLTVFLVLFVRGHQCGVPSAVARIAAVRACARRWPDARSCCPWSSR